VVAKPARIPSTYQDIEALPANVVGELIAGTLYATPRPASPHAAASSALGEELGPPFKRGRGGPGGWVILDEPELHFGSDVLVPDLGGWRRERMPEMPHVPAFTLAPDWICEVLSPSTAALDRGAKMPVYAREGVHHLWFVDPLLHTLEVFRLDGPGYRVVGTWHDEAKVRTEPFEAFELDLAVLWAR
jgi:Uma2 family endonuclease